LNSVSIMKLCPRHSNVTLQKDQYSFDGWIIFKKFPLYLELCLSLCALMTSYVVMTGQCGEGGWRHPEILIAEKI
jgi:hypothetical protein